MFSQKSSPCMGTSWAFLLIIETSWTAASWDPFQDLKCTGQTCCHFQPKPQVHHYWWGTKSLREKFEGKPQAAKPPTWTKLWPSPCPSLMVRVSKTSKTSEASKETTPVSRSKGKASHSMSRDSAQLPLRRGYSSEASKFLSDPNLITWFHFCWCLFKICFGTRCNSLSCLWQCLSLREAVKNVLAEFVR